MDELEQMKKDISDEPFKDVWGDTRPAGFYWYDSEVDWYAVNDVAYWLMLPDTEGIVKKEE